MFELGWRVKVTNTNKHSTLNAAASATMCSHSHVCKLRGCRSSSFFLGPRRQPVSTKTLTKPSLGPSSLSGSEARGVTDTSPDQSDGTEDAASFEQDEVAAARAQLKARAGAKGRRGGKAGGQGQVRGDCPIEKQACGQPCRVSPG